MSITPVYAALTYPFYIYDGSNSVAFRDAIADVVGYMTVTITSADEDSVTLHFQPLPDMAMDAYTTVVPTGHLLCPRVDQQPIDPAIFAQQFVQVPS